MVQLETRSPQVLRQALPAALCTRWLQQVEAAQPAAPDGQRPSCLADKVLDIDEVLRAVAACPLRAALEQALGPAPLCNIDQSWLRHGRPAHHWHQDGALQFDFLARAGHPTPPDALLTLRTCWIALTACGEHAPGMEWVDEPTPRLLWPHELTPDAVDARHAAGQRRRPVMQPGDAMLFDGTLLHRTHLTPQMTGSRTSLELRFFRADAWPARLAHHRRMALPRTATAA